MGTDLQNSVPGKCEGVENGIDRVGAKSVWKIGKMFSKTIVDYETALFPSVF